MFLGFVMICNGQNLFIFDLILYKITFDDFKVLKYLTHSMI